MDRDRHSRRQVRYSALIRTYSALRSHVHIRARARAARAEIDRRRRCPLPARYSAAFGARSSCGLPLLNSVTSPILHARADRARSRRRRGRRPRPAGPSSGSPPWMAVFTSGEFAIARAARLASASDVAPVTCDRDQLGRALAAADDADARVARTPPRSAFDEQRDSRLRRSSRRSRRSPARTRSRWSSTRRRR